jgi:ABC-type uncharacterized transport system permease subunit
MLLALACFLLYVLAAGAISSRLFHDLGPNRKLSNLLALGALLAHLMILASSIMIEPGQNMSMLNVASLIAWLIALSMTLASFSMPNIILLPVVYGFTALVVLFNLLVPDTYIVHIEVRPALLVHITIALFAYGSLMIAMLYAMQLSYISARLKQKQASLLHSSLPPLMAVESIFFKLLMVGTILLTLSLLSGFVFLDNMFTKEQAHKTVLSLMAWLVYCSVLIGHHKLGWRGRPMIISTLVGSILLTLAYFGSRFVREVILN